MVRLSISLLHPGQYRTAKAATKEEEEKEFRDLRDRERISGIRKKFSLLIPKIIFIPKIPELFIFPPQGEY
jgi:hypothetical protein